MTNSLLNEILERVNQLPDEKRQELVETAIESTKHLPWIPSPGPQTQAFYSEADILLYGGEPGGGKSSLLLDRDWETMVDAWCFQ